jgi:peptidoglycan/xylan/chitin deacetylase (PgdA/CDA1 family)
MHGGAASEHIARERFLPALSAKTLKLYQQWAVKGMIGLTPERIARASSWSLERLLQTVEHFRKALVILNFHRLYSQTLQTRFDEGVFGDISLDYFLSQLSWLKKNTQVLSEDDVLNGIKHPSSLPSRGVLITFDDGYRDNYDLAYPALRDNNLPALFFVPTKLLIERRLGWWDIASYMVKHSKRQSMIHEDRLYSLGEQADRKRLIAVLHERFKTEPAARTNSLLEDLSKDLETDFPSAELQDAELMSFEQLGEMVRGGMAVGAHTHTHRVLATLEPEDQKRELEQSKAILEEQVGKPVRSLAYPVGRRDSFTEQTKRLAREVGYAMAFSFYSGINRPGRMDPFDLRRSFKRKPFETFTASILHPGRELRPMP